MECRHLISPVNEPELHFLVSHFAEQMHAATPEAMLLPDDDAFIYSTVFPPRLIISEGSLHQFSNEEFERRLCQEIRLLGQNRVSHAIH